MKNIKAMTIAAIFCAIICTISFGGNVYANVSGMGDECEYAYTLNGDDSKIKLEIADGDYTMEDRIVDKQGDTAPSLVKNGLIVASVYHPSESNRIIFRDAGLAHNTWAYEEADIPINVYYDFNNDGKWTDDEYVYQMTHHVNQIDRYDARMAVAQAAVNAYGTHDFENDMRAIDAYIYRNYKYGIKASNGLTFTCYNGAEIMRMWGETQYQKYGCFDNPYSEHRTYVTLDDHTVYESQGYKGDAPDPEEIARKELVLKNNGYSYNGQ